MLKREVEYGKVIKYDGYNGTIQGMDGTIYQVKNTDIIDKYYLQPNDYVTFDKECIHNTEIPNQYFARFVRILKK